MRFFSREAAGDFDDFRHTRHTADENELVNFAHGKLGVAQAFFKRNAGAFEQVVAKLFELGARELDVQVLRSGGVRRDEGQIDVGGIGGRKRDFGFFRFFFQALERDRVVAEVDSVFGFEAVDEPGNDAFVEIIAAELRVAVGGFDFKNAVADFENGNVIRSAAEVVNRDFFVGFFIQTVSEGSGGRFVDDAEHFEPCDRSRVLRGLALCVVKIRGNGDDRLRDFFAEIGFGVGFHFCENHRGDLFRGEGFRFAVHFRLNCGVAVFTFDDGERERFDFFLNFRKFATDQAFCRKDRVFRVRNGLAFCRLTDEAFAVFRKRDNGRRRARAFAVRDDDGFAAFHDSHARIGGTKVYSKNFTHSAFRLCKPRAKFLKNQEIKIRNEEEH